MKTILVGILIMAQIRTFDKEYLDELLKRDGATIVEIPEKLHGGVHIVFQCTCGITHHKLFRDISYYGGAFCKECCKKNKAQKARNTSIMNYGVINPSCAQEIKDKKVETYMKHYGMHPTKTKEVREKYKETCMLRYNVDNTAKLPEVKEKIKEIFNERYNGHPMYSEAIKEKVKETCIERYGGHQMHNEAVKEKVKETCIDRYGGHPMLNEDVKERIKETCIEKYGCYPIQTQEVRDKIIAANLSRYGVKYGVETQEVKDKIVATNMKKYGVKSPPQSQEIQEKIQKNAKKYKPYTMPSGEIRQIQGYEHFALDILLKEYTAEQIKSNRSEVPRITYKINEESKYYFPDLYIPHKNLIIEVKSTWTYQKEEEKNRIKAAATRACGYEFEFWIFDSKGIRVEQSE